MLSVRQTTVVLFGSFLSLLGCGGSSSESPEPVRPDSWQLELRGSRMAPHPEASNARSRPRDAVPPPAGKAPSTWGTGKTPPVATAGSTVALPE
jgi:hypothetical protein